jgi:hypothetical protein
MRESKGIAGLLVPHGGIMRIGRIVVIPVLATLAITGSAVYVPVASVATAPTANVVASSQWYFG